VASTISEVIVENRNPYASPRAEVADNVGQEYGEVHLFRPDGRLGRVRYIGYTAGLTILIAVAGFGLSAVAGVTGQAGVGLAIGGLTYVAIIVMQFLLTIQRAHDFNTSGWLSVLMLVPLVSLIFWFIPGTKHENQYGLPPPPNTAGVIVLACIFPFVFVVGILAAIAIPAYQDYTIRAQVSEGLNLAAVAKAAVAERFLNTDAVPADRRAAGMTAAATDTSGKYVASVDVDRGTILVTYGAAANAAIAGRVLAIQPYVTADKSVAWRCGKGSVPGGAVAIAADAVPANVATDIEPRFLPSACRP
jgi:type IV pilus assembly protein PilA